MRPDSTWRKHTLRLSVDGEVVDETTHSMHPYFRLEGGGVEVRARTNQLGNVLRAEIIREEGDVLLAPEPGSPAAELEKLARGQPKVGPDDQPEAVHEDVDRPVTGPPPRVSGPDRSPVPARRQASRIGSR